MWSKDYRVLVMQMYLKLQSYRKLSRLTEIPRSTLHRWVTKNPLLLRRKRAKRCTDIVVHTIHRVLNDNPYTLQTELKARVARDCAVDISSRTISRCIRRMNLSRKRTHRVVLKEGLVEERRAFRWQLSVIPPKDVISIDESAFYFDMKPQYGYSKKGTRLKVATHSCRQQRWTLLMAVSSSRVIDYELFQKSCDSVKFASFVSKLDVSGKRYLMMDNASIHTTEKVKAVLRSKGILPLLLPAYSPEFQPIECVFSMVKSTYRRLPAMPDNGQVPDDDCGREGDVFMRAMHSINCIDERALHNTFAHCWAASGL